MNTRVFKEFLKIVGKGAAILAIVVGGVGVCTYVAIELFGKELGSFLGIFAFWGFVALYAAWDYAKLRVNLQQAEEQRLIDTIASQTGSQ